MSSETTIWPSDDYDRELQDFVAGTRPAAALKAIVVKDQEMRARHFWGGIVTAHRADWQWLAELFRCHATGDEVAVTARIDALVAADPDSHRQHLVKVALDFKVLTRQSLRLIVPVVDQEFADELGLVARGSNIGIKLRPGLPGHEDAVIAAEHVPMDSLRIALAGIHEVGRF